MKEMVELDEVPWKRVYALYRKLKEQDPDHEYVLLVDEVGWVIHEVRTMRNLVDSHYFREKREGLPFSVVIQMRENDTWYTLEDNERGNLAHNCRRLNNRVENYAVKHMLRLLEKYE